MKYNLKSIMSQAWSWFKNEVELSEIEWVPYTETVASFSTYLKAAWAQEKERVADKQKEVKAASNSEELKAFNWAERKLGFKSTLSDLDKADAVTNEVKHFGFARSVWSCAMSAARMNKENQELVLA